MSAYSPTTYRFASTGKMVVEGGHEEARHGLTPPGRRLLTFARAQRRKIERRRGPIVRNHSAYFERVWAVGRFAGEAGRPEKKWLTISWNTRARRDRLAVRLDGPPQSELKLQCHVKIGR
jgi:hypothetical protein